MFTLLETLFQDPLYFLEYSLYRIPAVLIALVLHEWAHGYAAWRLGDPTAKMMGRLSLNPLRHLDPLGTVMMFLLGFGWAKPVPINPRYFKRPRRDDLIVSLAGIAMNLLLFLVFTLLMVLLHLLLWRPEVLAYYSVVELLGFQYDYIQYILAGYGHEWDALFARPELLWALRLCAQISMVNLYIALFNLLSVPPLDGSHVLNGVLLRRNPFVSEKVARIGMAVLLLLSFSGVLGRGLSFVADGLQAGILSLISMAFGV